MRTGSTEGKKVLAVRMVQDFDAQDRSFVTHGADEFRLEVVGAGRSAQFIETLPDLLRFSHHAIPSLALDIDVDLWEALMRMKSGFTPSREDLRGSWLSLQTFKEQVASMPSRELLIQASAGTMTSVRVADDGRIVAEPAYEPEEPPQGLETRLPCCSRCTSAGD